MSLVMKYLCRKAQERLDLRLMIELDFNGDISAPGYIRVNGGGVAEKVCRFSIS